MKKTITILLILLMIISLAFWKTKASDNELIYEFTSDELTRNQIVSDVVCKFNDPNRNYQKELSCPNDKKEYLLFGQEKLDGKMIPFIQRYINNNLVFESLVDEINGAKIVDGLYDGDVIILLLSTYTNLMTSTYKLIKINLNGEVVKEYKFDANYRTSPMGLIKIKDAYYVLGTSQATNILENQNINNAGVIFISSFNYDFEHLRSNIFGNLNGNNELLDFLEYDNKIYIHTKFNGTGNYKALKALLVINLYIYIDRTHYLSDDKYYLMPYLDSVALIKENSDKSINIMAFDNLLNVKMSKTIPVILTDENIGNIIGRVVEKNSKKYYYLIIDILGNHKSYLTIFNSDSDVIYSESFTSESYTVDFIIDDSEIYLFQNYGKKIEYISFLYMLLLDGNELICNDEHILCLDDNSSDLEFGTYFLDVSFKLKHIVVKTKLEKEVKLTCSVTDNNVYDVNHVLLFNAKAKLNNKDIESGYVIKDEGTYILTLTGKIDTVIISFTVKKLCVDLNSDVSINNSVKVSYKEEQTKNDSEIKLNYGNLSYDVASPKGIDNYFYYLIFCALGIITSILIFSIKFRRKIK